MTQQEPKISANICNEAVEPVLPPDEVARGRDLGVDVEGVERGLVVELGLRVLYGELVGVLYMG